MGQNQYESGVGGLQPTDEPLRHAPVDDGTGVEADLTDSVDMVEDLPRRSLNTESAGGYWNVENYLKALPTLDIVQVQETGMQSIEPTL